MDRLRDESGFTLIELLIASVLGLLVLGAAGGLLQMATWSQKSTSQRMEAVQQGRQTMDLITQRLRAQLCIGPSDPLFPGKNAAVQAATADSITFYSSLAPAPTAAQSGMLQIDKRTIRFVPTSSGSIDGVIWEDIYPGTQVSAAVPPTFLPAPTKQRRLATVSRTAPGAPIFRYRRYDTTTSPATVELTALPISDANRELIVRIDVAFDAFPDQGGDSKLKTIYADQTFVRTADPLDPSHSPKCI